MKLRRSTLLVLVGAVLFGVVGVGCSLGVVSQLVSHISPRDNTATVMWVMKRRIVQYATANGSLPAAPEQLPHMAGYENSTTDGWGRPITWQVDGDTVTLTSYGRDGRAGGTGEDEDMVGVFRAKTEDGRWADELGDWQRDPSRGEK